MGANNWSSKNRELIGTSREHIEASSHELKQLASDLKRQIEEFPLAQYEHFLSIRNDIDIHRETILQEAYSLITRNINSKRIDKIHKKSSQMIEEVTRHETEFLNNFNKIIKPQLNEATPIDLANLRQYLEFFKNLEKDLHRNQYQNGRLSLKIQP